jgi:predicted DNA repair protein MutK
VKKPYVLDTLRIAREVYEADKIKGAIRTDFVLSAEIIVIALGTVADKPFATQVAVLAGIGAAWGVILWTLMEVAWPLLGGEGTGFQLVRALTVLPLYGLGGLAFGWLASLLRDGRDR